MKKFLLLLLVIVTTSVCASNNNNQTDRIHKQQAVKLSGGEAPTTAYGHKDLEKLNELKKKRIIQITKKELIVDPIKLGDYMEGLEKKHIGANLNLEILSISRILQAYSDEKNLDLVKKKIKKNKV